MNVPDNCLDNLDWYPWNDCDDILDLEFEDYWGGDIDYTKCPECGGVLNSTDEEDCEHLVICEDCCYIVDKENNVEY